MTEFLSAFAWIFDPAHSIGPGGIPARVTEHVWYSLMTILIAAAIAIPIGVAIGHTGRGRSVAVQISGALRALPTLGLVILLALLMSLGLVPPTIALVVLAIPPILAGAYSALESVNRATIDAARAVGMTQWQVLFKVELPLGLPLIMGGLRSAALQVIATWTVAGILPVGGLGRYLIDGLSVKDYAQMLAGSVLVVALALVVDALFAVVQKLTVPRGVSAGRQAGEIVKTPSRRNRATLSINS
ncbi:MAG: ABC transporter permease subunit [Microbacteriaceae bacterium]